MNILIKYPDSYFDIDTESPIGELKRLIIQYALERNKYYCMWTLRSLEKEINDESGQITIDESNEFVLKGFSIDLAKKMHILLNAAK